MNPNGILIGTWVLTWPIDLPINLTCLMNYIKIIFLQNKDPLIVNFFVKFFINYFGKMVID
jgi:hypothetical protein